MRSKGTPKTSIVLSFAQHDLLFEMENITDEGVDGYTYLELIEYNAIQQGYSIDQVRILSRCSLVDGFH